MKSISPGTVIGDDGLQIKIRHESILYIKNDYKIKIDTIFLDNILNVCLSMAENWVHPNQNEKLDALSRSTIERDILNGTRILNIDAKII